MKLTDELKAEIDLKTYEQLLSGWRNISIGSPIFQGESGDYWGKRMNELRNQPNGNEEHIRASKSIDWEK